MKQPSSLSSTTTLVVVVIGIMFSMSTTIEAQLPFPSGTCQPFAGAPLSQCGSVVNWNVFVPTNMTQAQLDAYVDRCNNRLSSLDGSRSNG